MEPSAGCKRKTGGNDGEGSKASARARAAGSQHLSELQIVACRGSIVGATSRAQPVIQSNTPVTEAAARVVQPLPPFVAAPSHASRACAAYSPIRSSWDGLTSDPASAKLKPTPSRPAIPPRVARTPATRSTASKRRSVGATVLTTCVTEDVPSGRSPSPRRLYRERIRSMAFIP